MLFDEGRDPRLIGRVNVQKLNADPCTFEKAADNRSTADFAQGSDSIRTVGCKSSAFGPQLEPQAQRPANVVAVIQFKEGSAGTENHEAPTGSHLASSVIDPHVNVEADLRA